MLTGDIIRRSANRFPDKTAVIWQDQKLTYRELDEASNRFAQALIAQGLTKGDHIGMVCRNRIEYAVVFFGSAKAGTVLVNLSVQYTAEMFDYSLEKGDVKCLFVEQPFVEATRPAYERLESLTSRIIIGAEEDTPEAATFESFMASAPSNEAPDVEMVPSDPFSMTFTGGTTGMPKGVLASHRSRDITAHTVMVEERLEDTDVVAIVTPMFHVAALNIMFQPAMLCGATTVLQTKWSVQEYIANVRQHQITACFMVPTQALMLVNYEQLDPGDLRTWRKISFAGAPMPNWVQEELLAKFPELRITQIYGQSEVGVVAALPHRFLPEKLGAVGRQAYNVDIAVLDPDGNPVKPGEIGELCSRGENVMLRYHNDPEETARFFRGGWGWTGDLAKVDEEGFMFLVDRSKDMLISGGENIYPKEIENALFRHDSVSDCAVIGVPDAKWGEAPVAYVMLRPEREATSEELIAHCERILTPYKVPHLVLLVPELPKTAMGKVQKHLLRAKYLEDFGGMAPLLVGQADAQAREASWGE
nr:acyl--CoA ligase [Actinomycetales bacterium]